MKIYKNLDDLCVGKGASFRDAVAQIDRSKIGIVLVVDHDRRLKGTLTDGDVRRAMLAAVNLEEPVSTLLARKAGTRYRRPITARIGQDWSTYGELLRRHKILHLPIVDDKRRVVGLVRAEEFLPEQKLPLHAVVMAGGRGSRLHPLTHDVPKPMLQIGNRPLLEIIIERLRDAGIEHVRITTHHKPEKIAEHFGDGTDFGVKLSYMAEDRPLGTVGGLGLMEPPTGTTLVMNGDILTQVDIRAMLVYHREHHAELTIGVRHYEMKVPYGVVECEGAFVRRLSEKPLVSAFVNAGIYLLEPGVYGYIHNGQKLDMTELIQRLLDDQRSVVSFPIREYWVDIGDQSDYEQAQSDLKQGVGVAQGTRRPSMKRRQAARTRKRRREPAPVAT